MANQARREDRIRLTFPLTTIGAVALYESVDSESVMGIAAQPSEAWNGVFAAVQMDPTDSTEWCGQHAGLDTVGDIDGQTEQGWQWIRRCRRSGRRR